MAHQNKRMIDGEMSAGLDTLVKLARHGGFTVELASLIRKKGGVNRAVEALLKEFRLYELNSFRISVEETLRRLRQANEKEGWSIEESVFKKLAETAPEWPEGKLAFRSLRVRFGFGTKGVAETFEAHAGRIKSVFGSKFWWSESLRSDKKHLRLLAGDKTHKPVIEWVTLGLNANRKRSSITAVRGPNSLADEGLVFSWMFPEYVQAIDYGDNPAFFLAGYELNISDQDSGTWWRVPYVRRYAIAGQVCLDAVWHSDAGLESSVPILRK